MINSNTQPLIKGVQSGVQTGYRLVVAIVCVLGVCFIVLAFPVALVACKAYCMAIGKRMDRVIVEVRAV